MNKAALRVISVVLIMLYLAACGSTTKVQPLGVHSANDHRKLTVNDEDKYTVKLRDGTEHEVYGNALRIEQNYIWAYSYVEQQWKSYPMSEVDEIYIEHVDRVKKRKNTALITGAAVLAAFAAAAAGGYFLEREMR